MEIQERYIRGIEMQSDESDCTEDREIKGRKDKVEEEERQERTRHGRMNYKDIKP
jgi:hypothetical protein